MSDLPPPEPKPLAPPAPPEYLRVGAPWQIESASPPSAATELLYAVIAGAAAALGVVLPWVKVTAPFLGSVSIAGLDTDDGKLVGLLAVIATALFADVRWRNQRKRGQVLGAWITAGAGAAIAIYDWATVNDAVSGVNDDGVGLATVGVGLYLSAGGLVVAAVAGFFAWRKMKRPAAA